VPYPFTFYDLAGPFGSEPGEFGPLCKRTLCGKGQGRSSTGADSDVVPVIDRNILTVVVGKNAHATTATAIIARITATAIRTEWRFVAIAFFRWPFFAKPQAALSNPQSLIPNPYLTLISQLNPPAAGR